MGGFDIQYIVVCRNNGEFSTPKHANLLTLLQLAPFPSLHNIDYLTPPLLPLIE